MLIEALRGYKIKLIQTTIAKYFTVQYKDKTYYIDYVNSDGQTLLLSNRDYWEILDEELEELYLCEFQNDTKEEKEQIKKNIKLANKLINFSIRHFNDYKPKLDC